MKAKKILSFILSISMLLSTLIMSSVSVSAAEPIDECTTENIQYVEGVIEIPDISDDTNEDCIPFEDVTIEIPIPKTSQDGIALAADYDVEVFVLSGGLKKYSSGTFTWYFNVDCPSSLIFKPDITVKLQLQASFTTESGSYSTLGSYSQLIDSNVDYGTDWTFTSTAKTGYYRYRYAIVHESDPTPVYKDTSSVLYNRTGHKWTFSFSDTGKVLPKPRADYVKGQIYARDTSLPARYYTEYTQKTGITLDTSKYDVHHIQPLAYGGNNDYSNLIHLPKDIHSSVTGWFNGY